ncbi:MAG TPA: diguanylate cyclase [Solirubrobacteraceae bacterium]|nr:diguanylate cyclase [Solirubrobacteraceae bacterium]
MSDQARPRPPGSNLDAELVSLRERLKRSEQHMAVTLMRATRLAQVISVLGAEQELETTVERVAIEVGELFFADMALLILDSDAGMTVAGHWGIGADDVPTEPFTLPDVVAATHTHSVRIGSVQELPVPVWLESYSARHVAWARLLVGDRSLGLLLLARRGDEAFEESEATELRAVAYRIALAVENGLLHKRMQIQLRQLHRLHELTAVFAGMLELDAVGRQVADTLVAEVAVASSLVLINRGGDWKILSSAGEDASTAIEGGPAPQLDDRWQRFPLKGAGETVGVVAVAGAPPVGSEAHEMLLHLISLGELSIDKALLYEQSREQARHDSLTGLLGHRVFHEELTAQLAAGQPFSMLLFDIDDFKQINDLNGHQIGDEALCLVSDALRRGTRSGDTVFRIGGEEFCALLPGLTEKDAPTAANALRHSVASMASALPNPLTVSIGVASFPAHGSTRDELLARADAAMYASKRRGKNCVSTAGEEPSETPVQSRREIGLDLLQEKDPDTVSHSLHVSILSVEIARALALDEARLEDLSTAARLHDIGKIAVPDSILAKPGPLDDEEFRLVKTHTTVGAELLSSAGLPGPAAIVRQHHEHIDGAGYPLGLSGEQISLEARIVHVADAYTAMTRDRPYRKAMPRNDALAELIRHAGSQFDADVVAALISVERDRPPPRILSEARLTGPRTRAYAGRPAGATTA